MVYPLIVSSVVEYFPIRMHTNIHTHIYIHTSSTRTHMHSYDILRDCHFSASWHHTGGSREQVHGSDLKHELVHDCTIKAQLLRMNTGTLGLRNIMCTF